MEISLLTDVGQKRTNNQDYVNHYVNRAGRTMIILADGMGGHRAGNIASEMAVTDLGVAWVDTQIDTVNEVREWFAHYLEIENQKIHQLGQDEAYRGMGTTLEVLAIIDNQAIYAHIGDSRIGLIRGEEYHQLTSDHSLVNELLKAGQLTPEEAEAHPQKYYHPVYWAKDEIQPDFGTVILESGDYLLLNSDGLTNMISGSEIRDIVTSDIPLADKTETLVRFANNAGGLDNITVALVSMNEEDAE